MKPPTIDAWQTTHPFSSNSLLKFLVAFIGTIFAFYPCSIRLFHTRYALFVMYSNRIVLGGKAPAADFKVFKVILQST